VAVRLEEYLGEGTSHGDETSYCCPFCVTRGKTPDTEEKLWINTVKGLYICYRCEAAGSVEYLLRSLGAPAEDTVELDEWHKRMLRLRGIHVPEDEAAAEPIPEDYVQHLVDNGCVPIQEGSGSWLYLRKRGITSEMIQYYQMVDGRGRYRYRIIVPTFDMTHRLTFFVARAIKPITFTKHGKNVEAPKYLNPKGGGRKFSLFNLNRAVEHPTVLVTEGVFSAIAAGASAVATFGKLVTDTQLRLLVEHCKDKEVVVCLDGDAHAETLNVSARLHARGMNTSMMILPFEHDPDSCPKDLFAKLLERRVPYSDTNVLRLQVNRAVRLPSEHKMEPILPSPDISEIRRRLANKG
jgi:hypothetical protein